MSKKINSDKTKNRKRLWWTLLLIPVLVGIAVMIYLDVIIRTTYDENKWAVPSTVYARPLELYEGAALTVKDLQTELSLLGYKFVGNPTKPGQANILGEQVHLYTPGFQFSDGLEPPRNISLTVKNGAVVKLDSDDHAALLRLEPVVIGGIYPAHNEDRLLVQLSEVPKSLQAMLVAVEDDSFYDHHGISVRGIARALVANIKQGGISQGASTLTQQLVKNYYLTSERTLSRKAQEALMAILLELHFSKDAILQGYINEIYLGQDGPRAIHGFGLASQYYFKTPLAELALDKQALLVALVRGASYYNPWRNPERALKRRDLVLDIAVREGRLDAELAAAAKAQPLGMGEQTASSTKRFPAYLDLVRRQLQRDYKVEDLSENGLSIFTHFDPLVQSSAELSLTKSIARHKRDGLSAKLEGAIVITRPNTGAVIAIVGGANTRFAGFNRAIDARRQVGSLIKPAVYLTALEQPEQYNLATVISDDEYNLPLPNGDVWSPKNYDKKNHGDVLLYSALAKSYNQSTARLGNEIGLANIVDTLRRLGVEQKVPELPAITLGAVDMSPLSVAQMYQTLSADGFYTPLLAISTVVDPKGEVLKSYPLAVDKRFDAGSVYMLRHAMQAVTHEGSGRALEWLLPDFEVAGKTGTTNNLRDSWFAGFSGDMMAVVWMGSDDNASIGLTGSSGALRVWADIFRQRSALPIQNLPPQNITVGWVDKETGQGSQGSCFNSIPLPFISGYEPEVELRCNQGVKRVIEWFRDLVE
ncbi:penicillin-binding protein 1B [Moritella marina ATCC 15381]|uniref:Penicillin-binding protein 1B n=1 Tax=Moritella marina ATCC 15381 TaxID=1202962 RepID=A0A5J6WK18_MORMI|nr:penicillin-binding protein 1B [Moritella marina]QFI37175.1 penicillin-binding protein 1B [Moritella marina ATCC 15381]